MKKIFALSLLIAVSFSISCSQTPTTDNQTSALDGPVLKFEVLEHNFGIIPKNGNGTYEFVFSNAGTTPLILSNVKSSCGCTIPEWPKDPIPAGKESVIKVKYDTRRVGNFVKSISIYSNAQDAPVVLRIRGQVVDQAAPAAN